VRRQCRSENTGGFALLKPADAYRVSGGSVLDAVSEEEEERPSMGMPGANPTTGVSLYYSLPQGADTATLTLDLSGRY